MPTKRIKKTGSHLGGFPSAANLGGKVLHYRDKQNIYRQGTPAYTLFYIQEGGVRLTTRSKDRPAAVTAILGVGYFLVSFAWQTILYACLRLSR